MRSLCRLTQPLTISTLCSSGFFVVFTLSITRVLNHIFINKTELIEGATERAVNVTRELGRRLNSQNDEADKEEDKK